MLQHLKIRKILLPICCLISFTMIIRQNYLVLQGHLAFQLDLPAWSQFP
jgi:hypothetical protein